MYFTAEFKQIAYEAMVRGERLESVLEMYGTTPGYSAKFASEDWHKDCISSPNARADFGRRKGKNGKVSRK